MEIKNIILIVVIILNLTWGFFVYWQNKKSTINIAYGVISLGIAGWALTNAFFQGVTTVESALFWARWSDVSAILLVSSLFYFSLVFPKEISTFRRCTTYLFYFCTSGILLILVLIPDFARKDVVFYNETQKQIITGKGFSVFAFYILLFIIWTIVNLIKKYRISQGIIKLQLRYVFIGLSLSAIVGVTFNLILPLMKNYRLVWLGPDCALILLVFIGYAITKHHLFNIRVIATELLTFAIWIFLLARTLLSETLREWIINGSLFVAIVFFGVLLIRSVIKEVELRERVKRAYEIEKRARKQVEQVTEAKTQFIMATQHHLRTPLTSMIGYLDLIFGGTYGKVPLKLKTTLLKFQVSTKRLIRVVNTLLDISQFQLGKKVVALKPGIKFEDLIKEVVEELQFEVKIRGLYLNYEKKGTVPAIKADPEKLKVALFNIIDNGIKYTQEGGLKMKLEKVGSKVQLSIKDTGMGIKPDQAKKLFKQAFSRGSGAKKAYGLGRGIGLYVTAHIIKGHNGKIWAESEGKGKGSTFFIQLPSE